MQKIIHEIGRRKIIAAIAIVVASGGIGYSYSYSYGLYQDLKRTEAEFASSTVAFQETIARLEQNIADVREENANITATLSDEQRKNLDLEREKRRNEREIEELTKLTTIDPELLKKYSKVYFLSENYVPAGLEYIDTEYLIDPNRPISVLRDIAGHLEDLLERAKRDGADLRVTSGYRSFEDQRALKSGYLVNYGTGANTFSAEQGYSEHQLGTAVDFTTSQIKSAHSSFENTAAFAWLVDNAHKYGFILSYPKGNSYYVYEPWHWRFVGEDLAKDLYDDNMRFYDMDQREIDEYLIDIFE